MKVSKAQIKTGSQKVDSKDAVDAVDSLKSKDPKVDAVDSKAKSKDEKVDAKLGSEKSKSTDKPQEIKLVVKPKEEQKSAPERDASAANVKQQGK